MKRFSLILIILTCFLLNSCITTGATIGYLDRDISPKASKERQEEVKNQIIKLLEEEYKQPFKLEHFEYIYKNHYDGRDLSSSEYGTYYFKVQALNNPIITISFKIVGGEDDAKESIKPLIDSFKKNQLNDLYCGYFDTYYSKHFEAIKENKSKDVEKSEAFCDSRDQSYYKRWDRIYNR